jgi:putative membrane protein insertion efficiency factor
MKSQARIATTRLNTIARYPALAAIAIYRAIISPMLQALFGRACRFEPSCSVYAADAIREHGLIRGGAMAAWRIVRCNPLARHGFDPVPKNNSIHATSPSLDQHQVIKSGARN